MSVRTVAIGCAALAATMLVPLPASAAAHRSVSCAKPTPVRNYSPTVMHYGMRVDLSGCSWWDGEPIQMSASIERMTGSRSEGAGAGTSCGYARAEPARGPFSSPRFEANPTCEVGVEFPHPRAETVRYEGSITYPGPDGESTVGFSALCVSTLVVARCVDFGDA